MDKELDRKLKRFFNQLTDRPLEPNDQAYVPFLEEGSEAAVDPIHALAKRISWSEAASVSLLSGQRGTGKSTELRRLRKILSDDDCVVFLCDMRDYMNLTTPVEISDFLISIMSGLGDAVNDLFQRDLAKETLWTRLFTFLATEVQIKDIKIGVDAAVAKGEFVASLRDDPTFRIQLQQHLRGHVARLVKQAHQFASEVVDFVRACKNNPDQKVVLIVDSVEQIRGVGSDADNVYKSVENLFSGHADSLHIPKLHVVYTIPPYLTSLVPNLGQLFGGNALCNLPSVHVRRRDGDSDKSGLDIMTRIVQNRESGWPQFFARQHLDRLALSAGGDIRGFFYLIKDCLVRASSMKETKLPVPDQILTNAENQLRREMLPLPAEDVKWLKRITATKQPELDTIKELPHLARFFDTRVVINYRNDVDWYDVHPLLIDTL